MNIYLGGQIGVEFFFLVSGCMMMASGLRTSYTEGMGKGTFSFIKHKISRLLPHYYLAWLLSFIVMHIGVDSIKAVLSDGVNSIWELLFLTQTGLSGYRANDVTWYISAMLIVMCLIYPFVYKYREEFPYFAIPVFFLMMGYT